MRKMDHREVQDRLPEILEHLERDRPISVHVDGKEAAVMLAPSLLDVRPASAPEGVNSKVEALAKISFAKHRQVYASLRQYEIDHPEDPSA